MIKVDVCLTPELIHQHKLEGKIAVVVDIFRATSCMVTGLASGVKAIYPVATVDECLALGQEGMVTAGERGGQKIEEFDIGNSPFDYQRPEFVGREIAVSTTNGTITIEKSKQAAEVLVGAFLNLQATAEYVLKRNLPVLIHCAGWKGTPNLEDTLYAGALLEALAGHAEAEGDSAFLARSLFQQHRDNLLAAARQSGHAHRLAGFGITKDIDFCMQQNVFSLVARMEGNRLTSV